MRIGCRSDKRPMSKVRTQVMPQLLGDDRGLTLLQVACLQHGQAPPESYMSNRIRPLPLRMGEPFAGAIHLKITSLLITCCAPKLRDISAAFL